MIFYILTASAAAQSGLMPAASVTLSREDKKLQSLECSQACGDMHRSSTYAKPGGPKNDPRPVSDKAYQANCIKSLIVYLSTHGYDQALTPKMLSNPMGKDVMHILQFLMHQV